MKEEEHKELAELRKFHPSSMSSERLNRYLELSNQDIDRRYKRDNLLLLGAGALALLGWTCVANPFRKAAGPEKGQTWEQRQDEENKAVDQTEKPGAQR